MFFDWTRIYPRTLELVDLAREVLDGLPTGYGFLLEIFYLEAVDA